eukprot:COSAG05_NODE_15230_length_375_cov_0.721014_1_plen_25_part_10
MTLFQAYPTHDALDGVWPHDALMEG